MIFSFTSHPPSLFPVRRIAFAKNNPGNQIFPGQRWRNFATASVRVRTWSFS
jgi:hypothetical protein